MILIFGCRKESMDLLKMETDKFGFAITHLIQLTTILCRLIVSSICFIIRHEDMNKRRDLENGPLPFVRLTAVSREKNRPSQYVQVQFVVHWQFCWRLFKFDFKFIIRTSWRRTLSLFISSGLKHMAVSMCAARLVHHSR